jgi:hypothetical protein
MRSNVKGSSGGDKANLQEMLEVGHIGDKIGL